jgi:hypothetical protein
MIGEAIRAAEGLGWVYLSHHRSRWLTFRMHIDGARWSNITPKEAEIRRRVWARESPCAVVEPR